MLTLRTNNLKVISPPSNREREVVRISDDVNRPQPLRGDEVFLVRDQIVPDGYRGYIFFEDRNKCESLRIPVGRPVIRLPSELNYLGHGDVVAVNWTHPSLRVLYRYKSLHNSFLVTERCNHLCLMCSQPPRNVEDSWLIDEMLVAIPLIAPTTKVLGFTGGEPTLLGEHFLRVLLTAKNYLPQTSLHILTNGRCFSDENCAAQYAAIRHPDMTFGIPLYSDVSTVHDYVVQADDAFDETVRGILNLKRLRQKVEIRVVIHKQTYKRLPQLAEFIVRNLAMVDHVALMGLEMMGFTLANLQSLWIDPWDYREELYKATTILADHRMHVSIYNHQLCVIDHRIWPFAKRSISDWKNEYMPECAECQVRDHCGAFFASAKHRYSDHIRHVVDPTGLVLPA